MNYLYKKLADPKFYNLKAKIGKIFTLGQNLPKKYLLKQIKPKKGDQILDIGCGIGSHAIFPEKYIGVDLNEKYIEHAKKNHQGTFLVMDAAKLEFPHDNFDYVFSVSLFHHISDIQVEKAINEMKRVCKKGGKILVMDAVFPNKLNLFGYLLFKLDRGKHTRTFDELKRLLSKHNFKLLTKNIEGSFLYRVSTFSYQK